MLFFGDTHGDLGAFDRLMREGRETLTEDDTVIVGGDFGFPYRGEETDGWKLDLLAEKPYTIAFVDGNHEHFPTILSAPVETWHGGKVHRIRKNIVHLMRGEIFEIEGYTLFAMGGANSIDRAYQRYQGTWWPEEIPSKEEIDNASANLARYGNRVDVVVTHTAPTELIRRMGYSPDLREQELTGFLEWVMYDVPFSAWFFGHFHEDRTFERGMRCLMKEIAVLPRRSEDRSET